MITAIFSSLKNTWQLQQAKNRLSEVVIQALRQGHQTSTRYGQPGVVVLSVKDFHRMRRRKESHGRQVV